MKLLDYVRRLLPKGVGDSEFGHPLLIENLHVWGWDYALRPSIRRTGSEAVIARRIVGIL